MSLSRKRPHREKPLLGCISLQSQFNVSSSFTAVIPVHNRADLLERLLDTLGKQSIAFNEILVVDNASTDGAPEIARAFGCRVIEMGENAGFARAVNRGWRAADSEWVAILNSDIELDSRWLEHLTVSAADASFATGTIVSAANHEIVDGTYDLVSRAACAWRAGHGEAARNGAQGSFPIVIAPGTACLYRRDVLDRLGGFDERYISYLEDVDLGLRCLHEGFAGLYVPQAMAYHHGSATLGQWNPRVVRLISRNQVMLVSRHYDLALFRSCFRAILAGQLLWGMVALRRGHPFAWIAGKIDGLRGFHLEGKPSPRLREFLAASESEIRRRATGPYWRWYFRLTSTGAL
jgi:GT2 family glycosyltransferase